jgi:hypothetical protein
MNSRSQRVVDDDLAELVAPLSGPSYGAYAIAKRRWHKPLGAILADALANSRALLSRLDRGMYMPDEQAHYREAFNELYRRTREQIKALEAFSTIDWRE